MGGEIDRFLAGGEKRIGRYRLRADGKLGQGGFAPVYLADELTDETSDETLQTVALKLFPLDGQRARITREGQALCRVKHDNVVTFNTMVADEALGIVAIVMEHVEGTSLDEKLSRGPLGVQEVLALGTQMASALETIHAAGIVHRDIKPANIIDSNGTYTLIDFGISTPEGGGAAAPADLDARALFTDLARGHAGGLTGMLHQAQRATKVTLLTHGIAGTLGYVDPRTIKGGVAADEKSDLYALGVTLFECASGVLPTVAAARETEILPEQRADVSARIFMGDEPPPSLSDVAPGVPLPLASLIDAMISPDAKDRPASAAAVRERLEKVRAAIAEAATAPTRSVPPAGSQPPRAAVSAPPPAPIDHEAKARALRKRDAEERARRWRNRVLFVLLLGALGGGAFAVWKLAFTGDSKDQEVRDAWASFQLCLLGANPKDAAAVTARWYVVKANVSIGAVDGKALTDQCPELGRAAYDKFRAARGPGSDFLERLSSYLDDVTHKSVAESDPIPLMNAALEANLADGKPSGKSPASAAVEPALTIDALKNAPPYDPPPDKEMDSAACNLWMPPKLRGKPPYSRVWAFEDTTIKIGPVGATGGIGDMDAAIKLEDDARVDDAKMVCNVPVFLVRKRGQVRLFIATDSGGSVTPTVLYPTSDAESLDVRDTQVEVSEICRTSSRAYYILSLGTNGLLVTWADGVFTATKLFGSGSALYSLECREGVGAWAVSASTRQFCPDGKPCAAFKPPETKTGCFDGSAWYAIAGGSTDGRASLDVGIKKWAFPFDQPPTTTLLFATTPKQPADLPMTLSCSARGAFVRNAAGVAVDVSGDAPRFLP